MLYVLDEPSIGLHQRDNQRLLSTLTYLRDLGNTVIVIEHDEDAMRLADHLVDIGPGAGEHGGYVIAEGTPEQVAANPESVTGQYLAGKRTIALPSTRTPVDPERVLRIEGASGNNLRDVTVDIPLGLFTCVTGVSGSGKSTLINETLSKAVSQKLNQARDEPAPYRALHGLDQIDKIVNIDQSPIGRTPRSNPATYTGLFTPIRELFAEVPAARERGYGPGRFSFNVAGGRCEACQGDGMLKVEMHFLADIYVPCDVCHGQRYNRETLEVQWKGRNIAQILEMTVEDAYHFLKPVPAIARKLQTLLDVGLSYVKLDGCPLGYHLRPLVAWYGDMDLVPHLWEAFCLGPIDVVVHYHPPLTVDQFGGSRKALALQCQKLVAEGVAHALAGRPGAVGPAYNDDKTHIAAVERAAAEAA